MGNLSKSQLTYLDTFKCPKCGHVRKVRRRVASAGRYVGTGCSKPGCFSTSWVRAGEYELS